MRCDMNETLNVIVDSLCRQGENSLGVTLASPNGQPLPSWTPGAHITLHLGEGLMRQYSLTGKGDSHAHYDICVARDRNSRGGSAYVHDILRPGQLVRISAPRNDFPLVSARKVILMAAGIGITPLYAMAESLEAAGIPFVLHYYLRKYGDAAFIRELSRPMRHGFCEVWYSSEGHSPRSHLPAELLSPQDGTHLYLCGPEGFMSAMAHSAAEKGWKEENIHREAFRLPQLPQGNAEEGAFTVTLSSSGRQFHIPADKTIAAVLTENGVSIPLSCEMGMCGACLTPVESGCIDHRDTVQSDEEKACGQQQIALCCSRSFSGNLVITL